MLRKPPRPHRFRWGQFLNRIDRFYQAGEWRAPVLRERGVDPFRVLVSTVLSHRTRDEVTERAALRLLDSYPNPAALARASPKEIQERVRDVGLSTAKSRGLHRAAIIITSEFGGSMPKTRAELLSLPLVGTKTANAILVFGFGVPAIPADTHIHRVSNRLGVVRTRNAEETSTALEAVVPRKYWYRLNPTLVQHGQNLCRAGTPKCDACPVEDLCFKIGVVAR